MMISSSPLSIVFTSALVLPVFPARSINSNVNSPFPVKVYPELPLLFITMIGSLHPVSVANTSWLVGVLGR